MNYDILAMLFVSKFAIGKGIGYQSGNRVQNDSDLTT